MVYGKEGISFVVVGDFGVIKHMDGPNDVFHDIDHMKKNAQPGSVEDFDFFLSVGDNLYPKDNTNPTSSEFLEMLDLFRTREHLKDIPIYPVRGNHDCVFEDEMDIEIKLKKEYAAWDFDELYYSKNFKLNDQGDIFQLVSVDTCFMLCETVGANKDYYYPLLSAENKEFFDTKCDGGSTYATLGNKQMDWIKNTFESTRNDEKVAWRATQAHVPMFLNNQPDAFNIIDRYLPVLRDHKVDVYFNGHEHVTSYAHAPDSSVDIVPPASLTADPGFFGSLKKETCERGLEYFWHDKTRNLEYNQGDYLH